MNDNQSSPREGYSAKPVLAYIVIRRERSCGETREYVEYVTAYRALAERYIDEHTTGEECLLIQPKFMPLAEWENIVYTKYEKDLSK